MSETITFVELLFKLGARELLISRSDATLAVVVVLLGSGRRLLAIERTYREGLRVLEDPTEEDLEIARGGNLWTLWNSKRSAYLSSLADFDDGLFGS